MSAGITVSAGTRTSLSGLADLSRQIEATQRRLSTGKRVASAADDPVAFSTASGLTARASSLNGLLSGMSGAQRTFEAAGTGIKAIRGLIEAAQTVATQALASAAPVAQVIGSRSGLTTSTSIAGMASSSTRLKAGDTVTVSDGTTTATYTAGSTDTVQTFLGAVNGTANLKVKASLNANGQIELAGSAGVGVTVGGTVTSPATLAGVLGVSAGTTAPPTSSARQAAAQQFEAIRAQIDRAVGDAGFKGTNLLGSGTLSVNFNESGGSKLSVNGLGLSASSLGLAAATGDFQSDADIGAALGNVTGALSSLDAQSGILSSSGDLLRIREEFTRSMIGTLNAGAQDLVAADVNEDSALLLALQTRQEIAATTLSLSNRQDQTVLRILGLG